MAKEKKIKKATKEELGKLQQEYEAVMGHVRTMSPIGLLVIAVLGIVIILTFQSNFLDLIGLVLLLYPLYIFVQRAAHREGYFEGYYEMMTKMGHREESSSPQQPSQQ